MARPATRYFFDEVFAIETREQSQPKPASFDQAAVDAAAAAAREEGLREGREAGRREAEAEGARRMADTSAKLFDVVVRLTERRVAEEQAAAEEAVRIGLAAARKLGGALVAREPGADIEAFLRECIAWATDAPHLVIRVADEVAEPLRERLDALAAEKGFRGRLVVLPDPELAPGDARVDWADGGAVRETGKLDAAVNDAVERYLAGRRPAGQD